VGNALSKVPLAGCLFNFGAAMDNIEEVPIAFWQSPMYHFNGEY